MPLIPVGRPVSTDARLESDDCPGLLDAEVCELVGRERIGALYEFELMIRSAEPLDPAEMHRAIASLVVVIDDNEVRRIPGEITRVEDMLVTETDHAVYKLSLRPRAHRATLIDTQEIFVDQSIKDVIETKLKRLGLEGTLDMWLSATYAQRELILQYDETDLAFVSRLAEHHGISIVFRSDGEDRITFIDDGNFPKIEATMEMMSRGEHVECFELSRAYDSVPDTYVVQDYNYRLPTLDITGEAPIEEGSGGGVAEYGPHYFTKEEGDAFAKIRAEEARARQLVYSGRSGRPDLSAGHTVKLVGHPTLGELELLIVEVEHELRSPHSPNGVLGYGNRFKAIPADRMYRPPRVTPKPFMQGLYLALVQPNEEDLIGESSQLDDDGRYRVRFLFDTAPRQGPTSCAVRMLQPHSGAGHGMHFPLRPGVEVAIAFINGDPDRPAIVGSLDNPVTPSPTARGNSRANIISTASGIVLTMHDSK